jgi:hypothetical protein
VLTHARARPSSSILIWDTKPAVANNFQISANQPPGNSTSSLRIAQTVKFGRKLPHVWRTRHNVTAKNSESMHLAGAKLSKNSRMKRYKLALPTSSRKISKPKTKLKQMSRQGKIELMVKAGAMTERQAERAKKRLAEMPA